MLEINDFFDCSIASAVVGEVILIGVVLFEGEIMHNKVSFEALEGFSGYVVLVLELFGPF